MKLKHDKLLSNFAFNCNLRPCTKEHPGHDDDGDHHGGAVQVDPKLTLLAFNA